jgi:hypothetical protein
VTTTTSTATSSSASYAGSNHSNFSGSTGQAFYQAPSAPTLPEIKNNVYHNYGGGAEVSTGNRNSDTSPLNIDPLVTGRGNSFSYSLNNLGSAYVVDPNSRVFALPVSFTPGKRTWGPQATATNPLFSLTINSPTGGLKITSDTFPVSITGPGYVNIDLKDSRGVLVFRSSTPDSAGNFTGNGDTTLLLGGTQTLTAFAQDVLPSSSLVPQHTATATVVVTVATTTQSTTLISPAFFVATNGNDTNAGTITAPFATLSKAASAMAASSQTKTTYVLPGTYAPSSTLQITSAHNGCAFLYHPSYGPNSAIIDGSVHSVDWGVHGYGVSNSTWDGIRLTKFRSFGILIEGGVTGSGTTSPAVGNTVRNTEADNISNTATQSTAGIAFYNNAPQSKILNNYVHDCPAMGIILSTYNDHGISGSVIDSNRLQRCVTAATAGAGVADAGAIYLQNVNKTLLDNNITVSNNFITEHGGSGFDHVHAIYLDEDMNNVTVTGNVIGPPISSGGGNHDSSQIFVNDGLGNKIINNIIDLGTTGQIPAVIWSYNNYPGDGRGMPGNTFTDNIVLMSFAGSLNTYVSGDTGHMFIQGLATVQPGWYTIQNNMYYNAGGGAETTTGNYKGDTAPVHANPLITTGTGSLYPIAPTSPAYNPPVSFQPIRGGFGPNAGVSTPPPPTSSTVTLDSVVISSGMSLSNGNLTATCISNTWTPHSARISSPLPSSSKKYIEWKIDTKQQTGNNAICLLTSADGMDDPVGVGVSQGLQINGDGNVYFNNSGVMVLSGYSQGDVVQMWVDLATGAVRAGKNNTPWNSGNAIVTIDTTKTWYFATTITTPNDVATMRPTQASSTYTPPTGYSTLS